MNMWDNAKEAWGYLAAIGMALAGRGMALAMEKPMLTRSLFWEVPTAIGMGIVGSGIAEFLGLHGHQAAAVISALAYLGPSSIKPILQLAFRRS